MFPRPVLVPQETKVSGGRCRGDTVLESTGVPLVQSYGIVTDTETVGPVTVGCRPKRKTEPVRVPVNRGRLRTWIRGPRLSCPDALLVSFIPQRVTFRELFRIYYSSTVPMFTNPESLVK